MGVEVGVRAPKLSRGFDAKYAQSVVRLNRDVSLKFPSGFTHTLAVAVMLFP